MRAFLRRVSRTFELSLATMLLYRSNVIFFLVFESMFMVAQFLGVSIGFDLAGGSIAGWTRDQAMLLTAINTLSHQIFIFLFINSIFNVSVHVWNGYFDYLLLKPLHPLESIWVNGQVVISNIPSVFVSIGVLIYFMTQNLDFITWIQLPVFVLFIVAGVAVRVALALACVAPVFYAERFAESNEAFWSLTALGRYPLSVYPKAMEMGLTFALPLGMLAAIPASVLFGLHSMIYYAFAFIASLLFVWVCIGIFMRAMRSYQSVNAGVG